MPRRQNRPNSLSNKPPALHLPPGTPRQRPAWFDNEEQYQAFLKSTLDELGPQCVTASSIGVEHLDEDARKQLLSGHSVRPTLALVCRIYAKWDDAALFSRVGPYEQQLTLRLTGELGEKVIPRIEHGDILFPPAALIQLIRESIEWCDDSEVAPKAADKRSKAPNINDLTHLVLSISGDQERQGMEGLFDSWPPTDADLAKYYDAMTVDDDLVLSEMKRRMVSDLARMQTHAVMVPDLVLGDAYETWFKAWPQDAPHDLIGDTPHDAFRNGAGAPIEDMIKLGVTLWERTKRGDVEFDLSEVATDLDASALDLMRNSASLSVAEYRKRLAQERKKGDLAHRRYTFAERPLIRFKDGGYLAIRPAWVLDRFCGSHLYWQAFFGFGEEKDRRGEQLSLAMNYVFEQSVGYIFRRIARRSGSSITLITEKEMQRVWAGKNKPSLCDWVLVSGKYCVLVDATNHWLDARTAQGFADVEDYAADVEQTFVNKKFQQLKSTITHLAEHGWEGCQFDEETVYVPMVVVPNTGIPPVVLADVDIKLRAHSVLGQLGKSVTSPGILIYRDLQVLEGVCEHRVPKAFVELVAQWRMLCTQTMPVSSQHFLDMCGVDRPMSTYPGLARTMLMQRLSGSS